MKSIKTFVSLSTLVVCMGAASMVNAYSFSPKSTPFTATGSIAVPSSPSCGLTLTGNTNTTGIATISGATVTGAGTCALLQINNLPWTVTPASFTSATIAHVGLKITVPPFPATVCGPSTINVTWVPGGGATLPKLTATNQPLSGGVSGSCRIVSLDLVVNNTAAPATLIAITNP